MDMDASTRTRAKMNINTNPGQGANTASDASTGICVDNIAVYVEAVTKEYRLGVLDRSTFREELREKFAGREDRRESLARGKETPGSSEVSAGKSEVASGKSDGDRPYIRALNDVSFIVNKGERVGIIGRNGAGKSTLLKLICRISEPTEGFIGVNGKVTSMLEIGVGFHPELTGRENIYLSGSILGMKKQDIDSKFDDIVAFSGVEKFIDTPIKRYSLGMYVRLAFAVSAHLNADIIILDEVLAVGDAEFQGKCIAKLREVAGEEKKTILYVSHNLDTVRALCDRCIVLDQGKIVFDGDVESAEKVYKELMIESL